MKRTLLLASILMLTPSLSLAQQREAGEEEKGTEPIDEERGGEAEDVIGLSSTALETINRILEADWEAQGTSELGYDGGSRRDPFLSLLGRSNRVRARGPRPEGKPGLLIDDITLMGVFVTPGGAIAQVQASRNSASYLLREGDQLYDGEVLSIRFEKNELAEVVFKQGVQDPAAIKPFREVVKKIAP